VITNLGDYKRIKDWLFPNIRYIVGRPDSKNYVNSPDESPTKYTPLFNNSSKDFAIIGCRESPKYFTKDFALKLYDSFLNNSKDLVSSLYGDLSDVISVNVRRGDKLKQQREYTILTKDWINEALDMCDSSNRVIFTSDDIEWCKENFIGDRFIFSDRNDGSTPQEVIDLRIQTMCKDNIISNGTFSWWGAFLNTNKNRRVFYSLPWYKVSGTYDIIPENDNWIEIK
jgi:hypothetical protein